jgi:hypothetical protein
MDYEIFFNNLGFSDAQQLDSIPPKDIQKKFNEWMKKNHPDKQGGKEDPQVINFKFI